MKNEQLSRSTWLPAFVEALAGLKPTPYTFRTRWWFFVRRSSFLFLVLSSSFFVLHGSTTQQPARTPDIHYAPTRHEVAEAMLELAGVTKDDVVYDLVSGDGRLPIIAAQKYGARGVGIEIDPKLIERARQNARDAGVVDRVTFIEG